MNLQVNLTRKVIAYDCFPEKVLFDIDNKQTILLPEWEAAFWEFICEHKKIHVDDLISFFNLNEDELELFYKHIDALKQLKLVELIE